MYAGLKLALQAARFDGDYFLYDWRLNSRDLSAALKTKLASLDLGKVHSRRTAWAALCRAALNRAKKVRLNIYEGLLAGQPLGPCVTTVRQVVESESGADWADYLHNGRRISCLNPATRDRQSHHICQPLPCHWHCINKRALVLLFNSSFAYDHFRSSGMPEMRGSTCDAEGRTLFQ